MNSTASAAPAFHHTPGYASEVRFGVVLYGGVSLAIYMNGVVNEMYEMVCATPKEGPQTGPFTDAQAGTREIYRRLALLANNDALRKKYAALIHQCRQQPGQALEDVWNRIENSHRYAPVRLLVDVVAGTSAGGINGIFLAKALTNGKPFSPLQELWVKEGDIDLLLNDERSYEGLKIKRSNRSLLNSGRMYLKLYDALEKMNGAEQPDGTPAPERSLVDEIDLFITTTDIIGAPVPLRLSGQVVTERRHKQDFHFGYAVDSHRDDFVAKNNAILAFAARCTASFPFAFEPMTMQAVMDLPRKVLDTEKQNLQDWHHYLSYLPQSEIDDGTHNRRAFGDGGYLDNKPFSYVAKTLSTRQALVSVERKLVYVEPAPESQDTRRESRSANGTDAPDALANSLAALTSIPRYETIREDLQEVLKRNRSIERVDRILRDGEIDLHEMLKRANPYVRILKKSEGKIPPWPEFDRGKMVRFYGTAVLAYRRIRVSTVTDELAYRLARLWDIDFQSDHLYALTALLREWRDWHYQEGQEDEEEKPKAGAPEKINAFFDRFDIDYRIRRLSFLLRQIDFLKHLLKCWTHDAALPEADKRSIERLKSEEHDGWRLQNEPASLERLHRALDRLKGDLNKVQGDWRKRKVYFFEEDSAKLPAEQPRKQLSAVLSLLLVGEPPTPNFELPLSNKNGGNRPIRLHDDTVQACACARTMQDSVMHRTKDLFRQLAGVDGRAGKTALYTALESSLASMHLPKQSPSAWEILGKPGLVLSGRPPEEKALVTIEDTGTALLDNAEGAWLRCLLGKYYLYFDLFDQMSFPLYHDAGVGEPATVEVVRVSPVDATHLIDEEKDKRRKLAGTALANFGAFLDRHWRLNDIMWGRLDGAERLIHTLLPMTDESTRLVRDELTRQAHHRILCKTFLPKGRETLLRETLAGLLLKAGAELQKKKNATQADHWIHDLLAQLNTGDPRQNKNLASLLSDLLNEKSLVDHVRQQRNVNRDFEPKSLLRNAARAITISGRMLDEISTGRNKIPVSFRWLARLGLVFQGLIAVSMPGSIKAYWRTHIVKVFYLFASLLALLALLLGNKEIGILAITVAVLVGLLHVLTLILGDILLSKGKWSWIRKGIACAVAAVSALAMVGGAALVVAPSRNALYAAAAAQLPPVLAMRYRAKSEAGNGQAALARSRIAGTAARSTP